jgi:hypothetical protein
VRPRAAVLLAAFVGVSVPASAQPTLDLSVGSSLQTLETSALAGRETQSSLGGGAGVGLDFVGGHGHVGYALDAGSYASAGDWSYRLHRLDGRYRLDLSPGTRLYAGVDGALRRNGDAWADADYDALGAFVNLEAAPRAGLTLRTGYRVDRRLFGAMPSLDQTEHGVFASLLVNLPSRTTLIAEVRPGLKGYRGETVLAGSGVVDPEYGRVPSTDGAADGSAGQGRAGRGTGGAMGPGARPAAPSFAPASRCRPPGARRAGAFRRPW